MGLCKIWKCTCHCRAFYGIKPAVTAIVFHATYRIGSKSLKNKYMYAIACAAFILILPLMLRSPYCAAGCFKWLSLK